MSSTLRHRLLGLALMAFGALPATSFGEPANCEQTAAEVREKTTKEPSKVVMFVEDALVMNEACACEIIKAAISASHADAAKVKEIVNAAIAVAPKMTKVIIECANGAQPGAVSVSDEPTVASAKTGGKEAKSVQPSGKNAVNVQPGGKTVAPVIEPPKDGGSDFSNWGVGAIRGVYLMAPAVGGFISDNQNDTPDDSVNRRGGKPRTIIIIRKEILVPTSNSNAMPGWQ